MKRRTLDILFGTGGLVLAGLLLIAGIVLNSNANFAKTYVADQLSEQHIKFTAADKLSDEEKKAACLVEYAGKALTTGKQAECYANEYIGLHIKNIAGGKTYADLGGVQSGLKAQVAEATAANAPNLADLQKQLDGVTAQRDTLFKGESLRGLLLTSYGFSVFGDKAAQAAWVAFGAAGLLLLLGIAGLIHALITPKTKGFAVPEPENVAATV
ncbi:hypothetical protein GCM10009682_60250 [Luedemannella flava]|uniref:Uncharacterized protein n=1 Tax=Luedemannella flava TaxID=349316 RepID=A0ABP4Z0H1_9ACTN